MRKEEGGSIVIHIFREGDHNLIEVVDNGMGMSEETINRIHQKAFGEESFPEEDQKGHTTGIGINNVIQRLRILYKREDVIRITSIEGVGTRVIIRIPQKR